MPGDKRVRVRPLPDGETREGWEAGWTGALLDIDFDEQPSVAAFPTGTAVEIESETRLYLGVLRQTRPSGVCVEVEHSLDRNRIAWIQDVWG